MNTSIPNNDVEPIGVEVSASLLTVALSDGRAVSAPVEWFPRLLHGTAKERGNFELMYDGIHWPDLNEDISVDGLLRGEKSGESPAAIKRWLDLRSKGKKEEIVELPLSPALSRKLEKLGVLKSKHSKMPIRARQKRLV